MGELRKPEEVQSPYGFSADEPVSFCSRETPAVCMPNELLREALAARSPGDEPLAIDLCDNPEQNGRSGAEPAASPASTSSTPAPSSQHSGVNEEAFWDKPPAYSLAPRSLWPRSLRPRPPAHRSRLARLLFALILVPVLLLFAHLLSSKYGIRWLDPTTLVHRIGLPR
jgi:hypothetical protein